MKKLVKYLITLLLIPAISTEAKAEVIHKYIHTTPSDAFKVTTEYINPNGTHGRSTVEVRGFEPGEMEFTFISPSFNPAYIETGKASIFYPKTIDNKRDNPIEDINYWSATEFASSLGGIGKLTEADGFAFHDSCLEAFNRASLALGLGMISEDYFGVDTNLYNRGSVILYEIDDNILKNLSADKRVAERFLMYVMSGTMEALGGQMEANLMNRDPDWNQTKEINKLNNQVYLVAKIAKSQGVSNWEGIVSEFYRDMYNLVLHYGVSISPASVIAAEAHIVSLRSKYPPVSLYSVFDSTDGYTDYVVEGIPNTVIVPKQESGK